MTSREIQAKLAEALHVIEQFETALRYRDSLNSSLYEDEAKRALLDFRDRFPAGADA